MTTAKRGYELKLAAAERTGLDPDRNQDCIAGTRSPSPAGSSNRLNVPAAECSSVPLLAELGIQRMDTHGPTLHRAVNTSFLKTNQTPSFIKRDAPVLDGIL